MEVNCIIYCCDPENPTISKFTDSNWEKIKKCAAFYLKNLSPEFYLLSEKLPNHKSGGYHMSCYRRLTVVSSSHTFIFSTPEPLTSQCHYHLRSDVSPINVSPNWAFGDVCILCRRNVRRVNQKKQHLTVGTSASVERSIKDLIKGKEDAEVSARVGSINFRANKASIIRSVSRNMLIPIKRK